MKVIYHNRSRLPEADEKACGATYVSKEELLRTADHVILVLPYTAQNHHTIGAKEIALMKPTATLVNIARGGIVDDLALAQALKENKIFAAGLDVFEGEPIVNPELLKLSNVVLAPHIASASEKTRRAMVDLAVDNLRAALAGQKPPSLKPRQIQISALFISGVSFTQLRFLLEVHARLVQCHRIYRLPSYKPYRQSRVNQSQVKHSE